jgi:Flp pilus assembly protein TadB
MRKVPKTRSGALRGFQFHLRELLFALPFLAIFFAIVAQASAVGLALHAAAMAGILLLFAYLLVMLMRQQHRDRRGKNGD